jgi:asparagine synthetase B (glutamine-hydrolysing)
VTRPQPLTRDNAIDAFIDVFRTAVARRPPRGRCAVPLSGGRDSRHILFELCRAHHRPVCVTAHPFPPRADDDAPIALIVAKAVGLSHEILDLEPSRVSAERRKNALTGFSTDWHAWFLAVADRLRGCVSDVYSGYGGDTLARGLPLDRQKLDLWESGDLDALATYLLTGNPDAEQALQIVLTPETADRFSLDLARARLVTELARHLNQPNPDLSFTFQNALRRRTAGQWFGVCADVATIYAPYLDQDVYDLLTSLPMSLQLDVSFHSDAIARAFPRYRNIPYAEGPMRPYAEGRMRRGYFRRFADELTAYAQSRPTSSIVDIDRFTLSLLASSRTGDGSTIELLSPARILCLLQLEEAVDATVGKRSIQIPLQHD